MRAAFTLLELVVVFGIFALVMTLGLPIGLESYRNYILTSELRNTVSLIRRAQGLAMANSYESSFGVSIQSNQTVIFKGQSYSGRNPAFDEVYPRSEGISISGMNEAVFTAISGAPSSTGTMVLSNQIASKTVILNEAGALNW